METTIPSCRTIEGWPIPWVSDLDPPSDLHAAILAAIRVILPTCRRPDPSPTATPPAPLPAPPTAVFPARARAQQHALSTAAPRPSRAQSTPTGTSPSILPHRREARFTSTECDSKTILYYRTARILILSYNQLPDQQCPTTQEQGPPTIPSFSTQNDDDWCLDHSHPPAFQLVLCNTINLTTVDHSLSGSRSVSEGRKGRAQRHLIRLVIREATP